MKTKFFPSHVATVAAVLLCMAPASPAHAAPRSAKAPAGKNDAAEELAMQARARFAAKDFAAAAKLFMQAYAKDQKPAMVFNAARAYEEAGMKGDAAGLFRLYVTIGQDADGVANAYERLRVLEGKATVPAEPAPAGLPAAATPTSPIHDAAAAKSAETDPVWPRWAATGAAVAGLATGVALILVARADSEAAVALPSRNDAEIATYNAKFDSAERLQTAGIAVTAVGIGLGAWAAWLHLHAPPKAAAWRIDTGPSVARLTVHF